MATGLSDALDRLLLHRRAAAAAAALFAGACLFDARTGVDIGAALLYAGPVFLAALVLGAAAGAAAAAAGGLAWLSLNSPLAQDGALVHLWNAAMRMGFLLLVAALARALIAMRRAQELTELKSRMLSLVSHDLNNFTTVIQMALTILEDSDQSPSEDRVRAYEALRSNTQKIGRTVSGFLDMARLESGRFQLNTRLVRLRSFVRSLADGFSFALEKKRLELELDIPEQSLPVRADPDVMTMVMGNLLSNAVKYTPEGGKVTVRLRRLDEKTAEVAVEDTGIGIPPRDREKVFSGFYRTQIGKDAAPGHGLGLKLTREMVALHGSTLTLEDAPGGGSRFRFTLPIHDGVEELKGDA